MTRIGTVLRLLAVVAGVTALLVGALAVGASLSGWRSARAEPEASAGVAAATGASSPTPPSLITSVTRDEAMALIRGLGETVRVDRIEAKLVPWTEFAAVGMGVDRTGGPAHGGGAPDVLWAVAVAGDTYPVFSDRAPKQHYAWALWGVNARRLQISTLKVGDSGVWPPGFDALADHVAVAPPAPTPTPSRISFDNLAATPQRLTKPIREMAASDPGGRYLWAIVLTGSRDVMGREATALMRSDDGGAGWTPVTGVTSHPFDVAAAGKVVLVSDAGADTADRGTTTSGGLFLSVDDGGTWEQVSRDGVARVEAFPYQGKAVFLAEHWWPTNGAATGASHIHASFDGRAWRDIGTVPGPASFGMLDVPLVSYSKNLPGDGVFRLAGTDLASLRLAPIAGSQQACCGAITSGPGGDLWAFVGSTRDLVRSTDGARTWQRASRGLAGRIAGLFVYHGVVYAIGDGAYRWDGASWQIADVLVAKAQSVFQLGESVFVFGSDGSLYKAPR